MSLYYNSKIKLAEFNAVIVIGRGFITKAVKNLVLVDKVTHCSIGSIATEIAHSTNWYEDKWLAGYSKSEVCLHEWWRR